MDAFTGMANNWHYVKQWQHLHEMKVAARMPIQLINAPPDYSRLDLPQSDRVMGRTISMLIKLSWTDDMLAERIDKINHALKG